jgi:sulfite reductase alpha subunit-like flavoprotein
VCSTTGDGEEPKNMKLFWRQLLSRQLSPHTFSGLKYSVLGLGDSSYAKFNYVAKRLFRRLEGLGRFELSLLLFWAVFNTLEV